MSYTNNKSWHTVINPESEDIHQNEFSADYHKFTPEEYHSCPVFGRDDETFKMMVENTDVGCTFMLRFDYLENVINVSRYTEELSPEYKYYTDVKELKYDNEGDEEKRVGRLARWFIRRLERGEMDEIIRTLPEFVEKFLEGKMSLRDLNSLWALVTK